MMNDYLDMSSYKSPLGGIPSALQMAHFGIIKKDPDWMSSDNRFMYKQIMCVNKFCFEKKTPGIRPCVYSHSQDEFNMAWQLYHMNAGNLSVALQYKQKEPPIDKSQPLWKKKILCQKCLADKPEPSCAYAHSNVEAAAASTAEATAEAEAAPTAATAPIDKSNSSWRKQIICQKCPPNQPPKASCGYSHSCIEFEAAWSLVKQKQADEEKAQKEKEEKAQEEKAQKEKEEKAQKVKEAKAQKAKEAKEKKEQEEKEAKEKKEQEEKAQKEKEEKAQKAKEARAQKAKEAKEAKEQEEKAAAATWAATWAALQEQKEKEEKEEKAQKAKEARAQKAKEAKAQKEAPPPPYEPQPPSPPPIVENDNVSTTSTSSSSKKKPAKEKIPSAVKRIVWNTYIGKDNLKGTCLCCNSEEVTVTNFECGHVKSEKNGGEVTVHNLRPICSNCNKSVGANDMDDFMKRYGISTPKNWNGLGGAAAAATATAAPKSKKDK